jgi:glucosamine--fructose-6-phosphate aminotransferase (isomerizing)
MNKKNNIDCFIFIYKTMCGIIAYLGNDIFTDYVLTGLTLLQNRGYDSVGISYIENQEIKTIKYASTNTNNSLEKLKGILLKENISSHCGIGHTRWATHGGKTDINSHPHNDNLDRISIVHNGIIENFRELKKKLIENGYFFKSQTDTEVIAVLIGYYLDNGEIIENAIKKTLEELTGTWALVITYKEFPNKIWITRNGSPLLLGLEEDYIMVVSEQIAFSNYMKKYIILDNHDLIEIAKEGKTITYSENVHRYPIKIKQLPNIQLQPCGYAHWMLKEIIEQPDAITRAINNGGRIESDYTVKLGGLDRNKERLLTINHLILLGCGTSFHAGLWAMDIFKSIDIFDTVSCYDGAEFNIKDIPKKGKSGVILLSQSGETKDLHRCIKIANDYDIITIGVVNVVDSLIARESECGIYLNAGREVGVASTKSFTNQCIILSMVSVWFSQNFNTCIEKRKQIISDLRKISFQIETLLHYTLKNPDFFKPYIEFLKLKKNMFILGKGRGEAIAKEGSLKIKEIAYIHAEGYSSSALKHGPFALIENKLPIILLDIEDEHRDKINNAYQEILSRDAYVIKISDIEGELKIEKNKTFGGLLANVYLQLLSYLLSVELGYSPDYPRNLAKVVTVE